MQELMKRFINQSSLSLITVLGVSCMGTEPDATSLQVQSEEGTATAPDPSQPSGLVAVDAPEADDSPSGGATTQDASCGGIFDPCGIVNNRTSRRLQVSRDSSSHFYCAPTGPYGWVDPGRNSNQSPPGFKDTDCFRSTECSVFYLGIWHPPGDWVRIHNSVFIYGLRC
jgi:hypothetical protein